MIDQTPAVHDLCRLNQLWGGKRSRGRFQREVATAVGAAAPGETTLQEIVHRRCAFGHNV
jgi:hypothetical protein